MRHRLDINTIYYDHPPNKSGFLCKNFHVLPMLNMNRLFQIPFKYLELVDETLPSFVAKMRYVVRNGIFKIISRPLLKLKASFRYVSD